MTLDMLLARARVEKWHCRQWFTGATLDGNRLTLAGDVDDAAFVMNCWLAEFQKHLPSIEVRAQRKGRHD